MNGSPKISVLLPVHNAAAYLDEALGSLQAQTFQDFEIVAVDDGSTDASAERLAAWARRGARLRVVGQARGGVAAALNAGFALCRGEWIARMDADDIALPERLAAQADFLARHVSVGVCGTWAREFGEGGERAMRPPEQDDAIRAWLLFGSPFMHPTVMFRRELCAAETGPYARLVGVEDYDLWARLACRTRFANLPSVLLRYRRHAAQYTAAKAAGHAAALAEVRGRVLAAAGVSAGSDTGLLAAAAAFDHEPHAPRPDAGAMAAWLSRLPGEAAAAGWCGEVALRRICGERWWAFMREGDGGPAAAREFLRGPAGVWGARAWWRALRLAARRWSGGGG